jgi:hypothetical protein
VFLQPPGQFTAGENDLMSAIAAFQADISTQSDDLPFKASAGMLFSQPDDIFQIYLW